LLILSSGYKLSALKPLDIAMVGLYYVIDQHSFFTFKEGINSMLIALNLPMDGLRNPKEFDEKKKIW
jgi:hypothetical protein